ncbi:MAG: SWIM zinc finger family protein [Actinomycetota bacterium]|jgi:hypothetical protein
MSAPGASREGRLVSTMIDVMLAGLCDPARFRRGREYARQGAVNDLLIASGIATAKVQGSRAQPYSVTIRTVPTTATSLDGEKLTSLVPTRDEVNFDCDCPDWDSPCKHAIAAMVFLSERIAYEPVLLSKWRALEPAETAPRATAGSRAGNAPSKPETNAVHLDAHAHAALNAFLGSHVSVKMPVLGSAPAAPEMWDEPWSFILNDALTALARKAP